MKRFFAVLLVSALLLVSAIMVPVFAEEIVARIECSTRADYETPTEVTTGQLVQLPDGANLVKEGYVFAGWSTDPNATEGFFEYRTTGDPVKFYAVWLPADSAAESAAAGETTAPDPSTESDSSDSTAAPDSGVESASVDSTAVADPNPENNSPDSPGDPAAPDSSEEATFAASEPTATAPATAPAPAEPDSAAAADEGTD